MISLGSIPYGLETGMQRPESISVGIQGFVFISVVQEGDG